MSHKKEKKNAKKIKKKSWLRVVQSLSRARFKLYYLHVSEIYKIFCFSLIYCISMELYF